MNLSLGTMFEFVLKNKGTKTFMGFSESDIYETLSYHLDKQQFFFAINQNSQLCGLILFEVNEDDKIVYVTENLAMNMATLRLFASMSKKRFAGYQLQWCKYGKEKRFNTEKFYRKIHV